MKFLKLSVASLLLSATAAATPGTFRSASYDDLQIDFLSWCEGNNVMAQNQEGKPYLRFRCEDQGQVCRVYDAYNFERVIYSANCEPK